MAPAASARLTGTMTLARSSRDKIIGGVCGGIAEQTGLSPTLVRILTIAIGLTPVPIILVYLILWIALPLR